jgi:hypothetical protein
MKFEFARQFFEKFSNINIHENCTVGAELFHSVCGRIDMTNLMVAFRNLVNAPNETRDPKHTSINRHLFWDVRVSLTKWFPPFRWIVVFSSSELSSCDCTFFLFLALKMNTLRSFETSKYAHANTQRHIKKAGHVSNVAVRILHRAYVNTSQAVLLSNVPL